MLRYSVTMTAGLALAVGACSGDGEGNTRGSSSSSTTLTTTTAASATDSGETASGTDTSGTSDATSASSSDSSTSGSGTGSDTASSSGAPKFDVSVETTGGNTMCDVISFEAKAEKPDIVFVLDKSGSMDFNTWQFNGMTMNRWDSLYLTVESVLNQFEDKADFGMELFPKKNAGSGECSADSPITVPVAPLNAANILANMPQLGATVAGQTPMGHGVTVGRDHLAAIASTKPQAMILVADGGVTTSCGSPNTSNEIVAILQSMAAQEVYTYVVGIDADTQSLVDQLNEFAVAGGQPLAGNEQFYNAQDGNALLMKMAEVVEGVLSCTIKLDKVPEFPDFTTVKIGGVEWPKVNDCNTEDGWVWTNEFDEITLCGAACMELKDKGTLDVEFSCPEG